VTQKERSQRGNVDRHSGDFRSNIRRDLVDYTECCAMCLLFPRHLPTTSEECPFGVESKNLESEVD